MNNPKKNFPVKHNGETYWVSRANAVVIFIFRERDGKTEVLTEIRGTGGDHVGERCVPCGYLEYNQTLADACVAEVFQETGMKIEKKRLELVFINDNPEADERQNVCFHYVYRAHPTEDFYLGNREGGEANEIESVEWVDIDKLPDDFCFGHKAYIEKYDLFNKLEQYRTKDGQYDLTKCKDEEFVNRAIKALSEDDGLVVVKTS